MKKTRKIKDIKMKGIKNVDIKKKLNKLFSASNKIGFRKKLIIGFLVPMVLIIVVGLVSYTRAKSTIISNYEDTSLGNVDNSALYFSLLMKDIESKSSQIAVDNDLIFYYARYGSENTAEVGTYYSGAKSTMANIAQSSDGIYNIYAFGKAGTLL